MDKFRNRLKSARQELQRAQQLYNEARQAYCNHRLERIRAGEDIEPMEFLGGTEYNDQVRREAVARKNAEIDRQVGFVTK